MLEREGLRFGHWLNMGSEERDWEGILNFVTQITGIPGGQAYFEVKLVS